MRIRSAKSSDVGPIARVHVDAWRTTYAGIVPDEYLAALSYSNRESSWDEILAADQPGASIFVAETHGGEVVGFANGGPEREGNQTYRGELYAVYLLEWHQRRGVGRRLCAAVAQRLLVDGFSSMLLWVLKDNHPACRFYESLGGQEVGRKTIAIGGTDLVEVSYGWKDIADLAAVLKESADR